MSGIEEAWGAFVNSPPMALNKWLWDRIFKHPEPPQVDLLPPQMKLPKQLPKPFDHKAALQKLQKEMEPDREPDQDIDDDLNKLLEQVDPVRTMGSQAPLKEPPPPPLKPLPAIPRPLPIPRGSELPDNQDVDEYERMRDEARARIQKKWGEYTGGASKR